MGLIEDFSELPLKWILIICVVLKIGLIVCLCGTDLCTSGEPTEHYKNQAETENNQQQVWLLKDNFKLTLYCIIDRNLHFLVYQARKISPWWIPLVFLVMVRHHTVPNLNFWSKKSNLRNFPSMCLRCKIISRSRFLEQKWKSYFLECNFRRKNSNLPKNRILAKNWILE